MRSSRVVDKVYPIVYEILPSGSIPASSDTVEYEGRQMKQYWINNIKNPSLEEN